MKSTLTLEISPEYEIVVSRGDKVTSGQVLAKSKKGSVLERIPISKILGVPKNSISTYLSVSLGKQVKKGATIALRQNIFKKTKVLSPFEGILESVDLKDGVLVITRLGKTGEKTEKAPLEGVIVDLKTGMITIGFEGRTIEGTQGKGERAFGQYILFDKRVDMLDLNVEVDGKIAIGSFFTDGARAKFSALGGAGIIALEFYDDISHSISLGEETLIDLVRALTVETPILMLGSRRRVIIPI